MYEPFTQISVKIILLDIKWLQKNFVCTSEVYLLITILLKDSFKYFVEVTMISLTEGRAEY